MTDTQNQVTAHVVPDALRVATAARLFGMHFSLRLEPAIFSIAGELAQDYRGGYWLFHALSNGGFFMSPEPRGSHQVVCSNGYGGELSAEAFGVTAFLYAYSQLSFFQGAFAEVCADHYHLLRAFALEHSEASAIFAACD